MTKYYEPCAHFQQRGVPSCACVLCKDCGHRTRKCNAGKDCRHDYPDPEFSGDLPGQDEGLDF